MFFKHYLQFAMLWQQATNCGIDLVITSQQLALEIVCYYVSLNLSGLTQHVTDTSPDWHVTLLTPLLTDTSRYWHLSWLTRHVTDTSPDWHVILQTPVLTDISLY